MQCKQYRQRGIFAAGLWFDAVFCGMQLVSRDCERVKRGALGLKRDKELFWCLRMKTGGTHHHQIQRTNGFQSWINKAFYCTTPCACGYGSDLHRSCWLAVIKTGKGWRELLPRSACLGFEFLFYSHLHVFGETISHRWWVVGIKHSWLKPCFVFSVGAFEESEVVWRLLKRLSSGAVPSLA